MGIDVAILDGGEGLVEFGVLLLIFLDGGETTLVDEDEVGVPFEEFFFVDHDGACLFGFVDNVDGVDDVEKGVLPLGAFDAMGATGTKTADVYGGFGFLGNVGGAGHEIVMGRLEEGDGLIGLGGICNGLTDDGE